MPGLCGWDWFRGAREVAKGDRSKFCPTHINDSLIGYSVKGQYPVDILERLNDPHTLVLNRVPLAENETRVGNWLTLEKTINAHVSCCGENHMGWLNPDAQTFPSRRQRETSLTTHCEANPCHDVVLPTE